MKAAESFGLTVPGPNLGICGDSCVTQVVTLIQEMLCFDPAKRPKISAIYEKIEELQGM